MRDTTRRIRLVKWLALVVSLLTVVAVLALYLLGRRARVREAGGSEEPVEAISSDEAGQRVGEGFDHTLMEENTPLFRIRGSRSRQTGESRFLVEEVHVTVFRTGEADLQVWAKEASYDLEAERARLTGDVRMEGSDGFTLETQELLVVASGDSVQIDGPLYFTYGGDRPLQGEANWFRANLRRDAFVLRDDVHLWNQTGAERSFSLRAPRLLLNRAENMARALEGVTAEWGDSHVRAQRITAHLDPVSHELHFLRAVTNVRARIRPASSEAEGYRNLVLEGSRIGILFDASGGPEKIELEDLDDGRSEIHATRVDGESFELVAAYAQGFLRSGVLTRAKAVDDVILTQTFSPPDGALEPPPTRTATGARMEAELGPRGNYRFVQLEGGVRIEEGPRVLEGETARILPETLECRGEPAVWSSEEGELRAPLITFHRESRLAHAEEGVRAVVKGEGARNEGPFSGTPMGGADEPIRVEAREAFLRDQPRSFLFRGDVRAWSGQQVLLTEQLRGDMDPQRLSAARGVETQWVIEPGQGEETRRVRVNATTMIYDPEARRIQYQTQVTVVEPRRRLTCESLTVHLDSEGELERMICEENVVLETEEEGRRVEAQRAEYDLSLREVRFYGDPVELTNRRGGRIQGKELLYSLDDETVRLSTEESERGISRGTQDPTGETGDAETRDLEVPDR